LLSFPDDYPEDVVFLNAAPEVKDLPRPSNVINDHTSYSIDVISFVNYFIGIINRVGNYSIPFLNSLSGFPSLDVDRFNKCNFNRIKEKFPGIAEADVLRDTALCFEAMRDFNTACALMVEALNFRPNGLFIRS